MLATKVREVLDRLERHGPEHDARAVRHADKLLNLERPTAELLYLLVSASQRRRILEIGTSNGISAIWLASALRQNGGRPLITIERDAHKAAQARANLQAAGLQPYAQVLEGDATALCQALVGSFDCVFFDADRLSAPAQFDALLPRLTADVLLLADNALSHAQEIAPYVRAVSVLPNVVSTVVPIGKGLHIARRETRAKE